MPIYDYICNAGHRLDSVRGNREQTTIPCPHCGTLARRVQVYRSQGVIFKGEGFTRSVVPPPRPPIKSTKKERTEEAWEIMDEVAGEQAEYDEKYRGED